MTNSRGMLSVEVTLPKRNSVPLLICLALATLTAIVFWSLKDCGFINYDDDVYVYKNAYVQTGLNWNSIVQAFSPESAKIIGHWHPVTWLSLMLDYSIYGLNPSGFHRTNLLFHVMNTILLFLILHRMTKTLWQSAFVATLFAIHPLHVESVAWIVERKDVLSTFFWMLTLGTYSYYIENRGFRRYSLVLLFFILGLMAKPMLVTLPFVLLLLDYWPLKRLQEINLAHRIQAEEVKKPAEPEYKWSLVHRLLWEKVPLFALAILSSIVTYVAAQSAGAVQSIEATPLSVRIGNAFVSYIAYMGKMIWPSNLAVYYPYPKVLDPWQVLWSVLLFTAITSIVIWRAKKTPYLATGWLLYVGTLVPVIGILQAGSQAMADRYTYIPLIGLFLVVAWGVPDLLEKWKYRKEILLASSVLSILCLSIITWAQVGYWQNTFTLFDHALQVTKDNYVAHTNLANALYIERRIEEAIDHYNRAIRIDPNNTNDYIGRGVAYSELGQYQRAIEDYNQAIRLKPDHANAIYNRGLSYDKVGQYKLAIEDFNKAINLNPIHSRAYNNRGLSYDKVGQYKLAIEDFNKAINLDANYTRAYNNRGLFYKKVGQYQLAIEDFNKAISLHPNYADAYNNRGNAYLSQGNNKLGCNDAQKACELGDCKLIEKAKSEGDCR